MNWIADLLQTVWSNLPLIVQQGIVSSIVALATGLVGKHLPFH